MSKRTIERRPPRRVVAKKSKAGQGLILVDDEERSWQQMYLVSRHWESDLTFFSDELNFFRKLVNKYFVWLIDEKNIESTRKLASDLLRFEKKRFTILQKVSVHVKHLSNLIENPFSHNAQTCKEEHGQLEAQFAEFSKDFRRIKGEVFTLSEKVMDSEKAKLLLNGS